MWQIVPGTKLEIWAIAFGAFSRDHDTLFDPLVHSHCHSARLLTDQMRPPSPASFAFGSWDPVQPCVARAILLASGWSQIRYYLTCSGIRNTTNLMFPVQRSGLTCNFLAPALALLAILGTVGSKQTDATQSVLFRPRQIDARILVTGDTTSATERPAIVSCPAHASILRKPWRFVGQPKPHPKPR